ncbi:hypothetical protein, partial [Shinella sumterensis]|uniref:hypothetical protein n=1 Tax=Shinella sumterensis TaxID=1967501 RepID=UPI003F8265D0
GALSGIPFWAGTAHMAGMTLPAIVRPCRSSNTDGKLQFVGRAVGSCHWRRGNIAVNPTLE